MSSFEIFDKNYKTRVSSSFTRQPFMDLIGAELVDVQPGYCEIQLPYKKELSQQHGYFHGGVIGTIADNCGGYAAYSLLPEGTSILTVEYKINLVAPGNGERLIGRAKVIKPGRTLMISSTEIFVVSNGVEKLCATSLMTLMAMHGKSDQPESTKA